MLTELYHKERDCKIFLSWTFFWVNGDWVHFKTYLYRSAHFHVIIYLTESQIDAVSHKAFLDAAFLLQ